MCRYYGAKLTNSGPVKAKQPGAELVFPMS